MLNQESRGLSWSRLSKQWAPAHPSHLLTQGLALTHQVPSTEFLLPVRHSDAEEVVKLLVYLEGAIPCNHEKTNSRNRQLRTEGRPPPPSSLQHPALRPGVSGLSDECAQLLQSWEVLSLVKLRPPSCLIASSPSLQCQKQWLFGVELLASAV